MEKGAGFLVAILIWGGIVYFFVRTPLLSELSGGQFLDSGLANLVSIVGEKKGTIDVLVGKNSQKPAVHFNKTIDIFDIKISPENPELIFAGTNHGLFVSRDAGLNWYNFSDVEHKIDSSSLVYKILLNNPEKSPVYSFISLFKDKRGMVYKSRDKFFSAEKILEIDNEAVYDFDTDGVNLYLGLSDGRLVLYSISKDEVRLLKKFNSPITNLKKIPEKGLIYLTLKSGGFWISQDNGQSFDRLEFLDNYRGANKVSKFIVSQSNQSLIYAATDYGLLRSSNAGETWQIFKSLPVENRKVSALAIQENPGEIFAASNGKIYKSGDYGLNWRILESNLNDREISAIAVNGDKIIIGTKQN